MECWFIIRHLVFFGKKSIPFILALYWAGVYTFRWSSNTCDWRRKGWGNTGRHRWTVEVYLGQKSGKSMFQYFVTVWTIIRLLYLLFTTYLIFAYSTCATKFILLCKSLHFQHTVKQHNKSTTSKYCRILLTKDNY